MFKLKSAMAFTLLTAVTILASACASNAQPVKSLFERMAEAYAGHGTKAGNALMYSHGLEITVEGNYLDLMSWLRSLETMPRKLLWDGEKMQVTNDAKANAFVRRVYRQGFELGT